MREWDIETDATTYAHLMKIHNTRGDHVSSLGRLREAEMRGTALNPTFYAEAIRTYVFLRKFATARDMLQRMIGCGLEADDDVRSAMIFLHASCGEHEGEETRPPPDFRTRLKSRSPEMEAKSRWLTEFLTISSVSVSRKKDLAQWLSKVAQYSPTGLVSAYCAALDGYARNDDLTHIVKIERDLERIELKKNSKELYLALLKTFSRFDGQAEKCRSLLREMKAAGLTVTKPVMEAFICTLARSGFLSEAEKRMKEELPTSSLAARVILTRKAEEGLHDEAMEWFKWMKKAERVRVGADAYEIVIAMKGRQATVEGTYR